MYMHDCPPQKKYDSYVGGWIEGQMDTRSLPGVPHQPAVYIKHHQDPTTWVGGVRL